MARIKSILREAKQIDRAVALIDLGARLQVLKSETELSYEWRCAYTEKSRARARARGSCRFRPTGS